MAGQRLGHVACLLVQNWRDMFRKVQWLEWVSVIVFDGDRGLQASPILHLI